MIYRDQQLKQYESTVSWTVVFCIGVLFLLFMWHMAKGWF